MNGRLSQFAIGQEVVLQAEPFLCPADDERNLCQGVPLLTAETAIYSQIILLQGE
jgi:hypothetical protein